ncbi:hypothetical protein D5282_08795 [bacterium 1xD8-48]|nr:hypothetical protein [bacterium 1xD8-48]
MIFTFSYHQDNSMIAFCQYTIIKTADKILTANLIFSIPVNRKLPYRLFYATLISDNFVLKRKSL